MVLVQCVDCVSHSIYRRLNNDDAHLYLRILLWSPQIRTELCWTMMYRYVPNSCNLLKRPRIACWRKLKFQRLYNARRLLFACQHALSEHPSLRVPCLSLATMGPLTENEAALLLSDGTFDYVNLLEVLMVDSIFWGECTFFTSKSSVESYCFFLCRYQFNVIRLCHLLLEASIPFSHSLNHFVYYQLILLSE